MSIINFCEIPKANTGDGDQDAFELFAASFLEQICGMRIVSGPNRGADGGKDLLAMERIHGALTDTEQLWLVSCKHLAHSGKSVSETDEQNITDRLVQHKACGFLGFYSTIVSSGLSNRLDSIKEKYRVSIFNRERIEDGLIRASDQILFKRFFPSSYGKWDGKIHTISRILENYEPLKCAYCGRDLLEKDAPDGIVVFSRNYITDITEHIYCVCKGSCDDACERIEDAKGRITGWEEISDFCIPTIYMLKYMAFLNTLYSGRKEYSKEAFDQLKGFLICISQAVLKPQTDEEMQRVSDLSQLPEGL